jgi:hypothetical protein
VVLGWRGLDCLFGGKKKKKKKLWRKIIFFREKIIFFFSRKKKSFFFSFLGVICVLFFSSSHLDHVVERDSTIVACVRVRVDEVGHDRQDNGRKRAGQQNGRETAHTNARVASFGAVDEYQKHEKQPDNSHCLCVFEVFVFCFFLTSGWSPTRADSWYAKERSWHDSENVPRDTRTTESRKKKKRIPKKFGKSGFLVVWVDVTAAALTYRVLS